MVGYCHNANNNISNLFSLLNMVNLKTEEKSFGGYREMLFDHFHTCKSITQRNPRR